VTAAIDNLSIDVEALKRLIRLDRDQFAVLMEHVSHARFAHA